MTTNEVHYEVRNHTAHIIIDRPERRNAMSLSVSRTLIEYFGTAEADTNVWAITVTGSGQDAFCAGADLKEFDDIARAGRQIPAPMTGTQRNVHEVVLETTKPTVAILNGPAIAGGCELALACDLRIAARHATIGMPEAKRGMGANFASVLLPRLVPRAVALEMLYLGEPITAEKALAYGLFNRVVDATELASTANSFVSALVENAPLTLRRYKEMATKTWEIPVHNALRMNVGPNPYASADREEGIRAYLEKRSPRWQNR
ncbi:enoyl-CoA hydratase/isomerase family protein [Rhodococcus sp. P1Y]|uniref:enoyl-CoA hydratase/isomerase family protein n=1 Tax=Rhodococcus sp. P1Y TaxID=1302308 RepID=UPI000EADBF3D|nr:enoyl-CoA hydratase/isomerase family protein [Rhodococcus sp. P1Y]AYJ48870.1 enoyl-CoA hydratase/isomerase family protein [Rhodococcus sp. P1Y]